MDATERSRKFSRAATFALKVQAPLILSLSFVPAWHFVHLPDMDAQVASAHHELFRPMRLVAFISSAAHTNDASCRFMAFPLIRSRFVCGLGVAIGAS